jgi:hypothetical protein
MARAKKARRNLRITVPVLIKHEIAWEVAIRIEGTFGTRGEGREN